MAKVVINRERCKGCFLCVAFCPKGLMQPDEKLNRQGLRPVEFQEKDECLGCAMCAVICPDCCIEVEK